MSAAAILQRSLRDARRHAGAQVLVVAAPWLVLIAAAGWRFGSVTWAVALTLLAAVACIGAAWRAAGRLDPRWLARKLDQQRADMEDSTSLLLHPDRVSGPLQRLQVARLRQRMENTQAPDLRAPWRSGLLLASFVLAGACIAAVLLWPPRPSARNPAPAATANARARPTLPPKLIAATIDIRPPAYTGLPERRIDTLQAKVPERSTLRWRLRFDPEPTRAGSMRAGSTQAGSTPAGSTPAEPTRVELVFVDGTRLPLQRGNSGWTAQRRIDESALYRLSIDGSDSPSAPLHRIDAVADLPPQLRALQPTSYLTVLDPGQRSWALAFDARDDYGLAASAQLRITRTEGSGEQITTKEQVLTLRGQGNATRKRFSHRVGLAALGMVAGDDVIVRLSVSDRRAPGPQTVHSPSFILRWPAEDSAETGGLDGLVKKTLPVYFRSQRQIIIDAEALLKEKPRLGADTYVERSDAIGVDQRLLRLRYGQFLGEESEGMPTQQLMPTNDAGDEHAGGNGHEDEHADDGEQQEQSASAADAGQDGHGHGPEPQREAVFGEPEAVLERFGHTHDHAEAATLLDPETRKLLKAALDEMWQSELNLRTGRPDLALPYANRALGFIKQVQQSTRIYLPRVGTELPPVDESRRMGGDREGLGDRADLLGEAIAEDPVVAEAWRALAPVGTTDAAALDLDALRRRLDDRDTRDETARARDNADDPGGDRLALAAAIDALQREPGCAACRERLRALLWPVLVRPPAAPGARPAAGRPGDAYLDALGREPAQ